MIECTAEIEIPAPQRQVWDALLDFEGYPEWNPYIAVRGAAALGSQVQWAYSSQLIKRIWTSATITELDEPNAITWSFRIGWLFSFEERFQVHSTGQGTQVSHSVRCRGVVAQLGSRSLRKTFAAVIRASNEGLRRHVSLSQKSGAAGVSRRAKAKKKGFRAPSRRR